MSVIQIIDIILIIVLLILGVEFIIKLKKNENKEIEQIRDSLIRRINVIITLIVITWILTLANIFINR